MIARRPIALLLMLAVAWLAPRAAAQEEPVSSLEELKEFYGKEVAARNKKDKDGTKRFVLSKPGTDLGFILGVNQFAKKDEKLIETIANYYVYRVTWRECTNDPDEMDFAINDFKDFYATRIILQSKNVELVNYLNKKLAESFKRVFERDFLKNRLSAVNAAQMLPGLGKGKSEDISNLLVWLINDAKQHDAVKLYAIKALKDYFPLQANVKDATGDTNRVLALTDYIEQKREIKETDKGRAEQELAAISFLRREAIQVLALAQLPIVKMPKKGAKLDGQVAVTLLKVAARKELTPPPPARGKLNTIAVMGLAERLQASFGLCDFKSEPGTGYQADFAVQAVAHCLSEFVEAYNADAPNLVKFDKKEFNGQGERKVPQLPWKTLAEHWQKSLQNLVNATEEDKNSVANAKAKKLHQESKTLLENMTNYTKVKQDEVDAFRRFAEGAELRPPVNVKSIFKGIDVTVNLGY